MAQQPESQVMLQPNALWSSFEKGFAAIEARTKSELTRKKNTLLRCKKTYQKRIER
jgi:hypothetical protein